MEYFKLTSLWIGWCFFHSYLITPSVTRFLNKYLGRRYYLFRLFYNLFAIISLIMVWRYHPIIEDNILFSWNGYLRVVQLLLFGSSIGLFIAGARKYDMLQFLGLRQLTQKRSTDGIGKAGGIVNTGIHRYTRHPWYLGGILMIWTGFFDLTISRLITNLVWTAYFIVGAVLEERKLLTEFGDEYLKYQKQVSMLFPVKSLTG